MHIEYSGRYFGNRRYVKYFYYSRTIKSNKPVFKFKNKKKISSNAKKRNYIYKNNFSYC